MAGRDTRYLEFHKGKWRIAVAVPRPLHHQLGTKLKRSLGTASLREAQRLRWPVVAELKATITTAPNTHREDEAEAWRTALAASSGGPYDPVKDTLHDHLDAMRGDPIATEADEKGNPVYIYDTERERRAVEFADRAHGRATPVDTYVDTYLASLAIAERTKDIHRRALGLLQEWCKRAGVSFTIQALTRKVAIRFVDDLPSIKAASPRYLTLQVGKLSLYWRWLIHREHALGPDGRPIEMDPWAGLKLTKARTPHNELERPFTDDEVRRLLSGPAIPAMADLMRIAALTGARLDAVVDLKAGDCHQGVFTFKPQKSETKPRRVPIHTTLVEMVDRRIEGKAPSDDLFPEWPLPPNGRERSQYASVDFTAYRRGVGVDEVVEGNRRSRVNFHSFRRWWITSAEQAGVQENLIAAVVGHRRPGLSLGLYSAGPSLEQLRGAVEAVKLP
jgi:site-specific recombinase XerC